jgi:hypothetical protein
MKSKPQKNNNYLYSKRVFLLFSDFVNKNKMTDFSLSKLKSTTGVSLRNKIVSYFFILSMIGISLIFSEKEIILPEMAALAIGCFIYENPVWISKPFHIFLLPSLTAVCGFLINKLDITMAEKLISILLLMLLILRLFKSSLAPALATGLLPVITNSTSNYFLLSILFFTLVLAVSITFRPNVSEVKKTLHQENQTKNSMLFLVFISCWIVFCSYYGMLFMAAIPPVIVVGYESVHKKEYNITIFYKQLICLFSAAFIGTQTLYLIDNLVIAALIDILLVSFILRLFKFKLPPAYAMAILPMVLHSFSHNYFYWQVLIMSSVVLGTVYFFKNTGFRFRNK